VITDSYKLYSLSVE